jgi:hypothetical protein
MTVKRNTCVKRFLSWDSWPRTVILAGIFSSTMISALPSQAIIYLQVQQLGNDVVVTGSGKANLTALTFFDDSSTFQNVLTDVQVFAGPSPFNSGAVDLYNGVISGPTSISSNPLLVEEPDPDASTGDLFGIIADLYRVVLPKGYASNNDLTGVSVFRNISISQLGLVSGQWTWGNTNDGTFDSINVDVVPAPLPIFASPLILSASRKLRQLSSRLKQFK